MPHRLLPLLALTVATATFAQEAEAPRAEDLRQLGSARSLGMGGAYRALGLGTEAVVGNPAAMALYKTYRVELTGAWDYRQKDAFFGATLMDASTSALAAGLDYHLVSLGRGAERVTAHLATLAFALPLSESLYLGGSARYLRMGGGRQASATTADSGLLLRLGPSVSVGVSGHNLIDTRNPELTPYYSAHLGFTSGTFTLAADVRGDFVTRPESTFTYSGGLEYILGDGVPLRAGYAYDGFTRSSRLGLGVGLVSQGSGIDFAYQHEFGGQEGRVVALTLKMQVH